MNLQFIFQALKENLTEGEIKELLLTTTSHGLTTLMAIFVYTRNVKNYEGLWSFVTDVMPDKNDQKEVLWKQNNSNQSALHYAIKSSNPEAFKFLFNVYRQTFETDKLNELILIKNPKGQRNLLIALEKLIDIQVMKML